MHVLYIKLFWRWKYLLDFSQKGLSWNVSALFIGRSLFDANMIHILNGNNGAFIFIKDKQTKKLDPHNLRIFEYLYDLMWPCYWCKEFIKISNIFSCITLNSYFSPTLAPWDMIWSNMNLCYNGILTW